MRLASLAIATLALASTAAAGSTAVGSAAELSTAPKPSCSAILQKVDGTKGFKVARNCAPGVLVAREPVANGMAQDEEDGNSGAFVTSFFAIGLIGGGIYLAIDDNDADLPDDEDGDGGLNPVSP